MTKREIADLRWAVGYLRDVLNETEDSIYDFIFTCLEKDERGTSGEV